MKLTVRHAGGELTVGSQKELLQLYNRRIVGDDDEVLRGDLWVRIGELPWIAGMRQDRRSDNRRLMWLTIAMLAVGLVAVLYLQRHSTEVAKRTFALPPGAVRAVPR